jgi:UDPglucose 6-dehydrogenase
MRISIVGTGYVGLVSGACLASIGHDVICVDLDERRVAAVNAGRPPIHEPGLEDLLTAAVGDRLTATTELADAVAATEVTLIAVGTPFDGERIGLQYIESASALIGATLADKDEYHLVVVKSTVVPGTTDSFVAPILESTSGRRLGTDFGLGMNPEFLREGSAVDDFMHPDRIVIGADDERSRRRLREVYQRFEGQTEMVETSTRAAEMIKYSSNSLLASLISFSNEIANLSALVGVDATEVMHGVHLDRRITPVVDGERIWPGSTTYLEGGCGFGGSCFPKDVKALIAFGTEYGLDMRVLRSVMDVNEAQPLKMLDLVDRHFDSLDGVPVTVLGMAFKPETDDIRESPSLTVTDELLRRGASVTVFDPIARDAVRATYGDALTYATDLDAAVTDATVVLLMTRWDQFADLPKILAGAGNEPLVVDGRRMLDPQSVARYEAIGR